MSELFSYDDFPNYTRASEKYNYPAPSEVVAGDIEESYKPKKYTSDEITRMNNFIDRLYNEYINAENPNHNWLYKMTKQISKCYAMTMPKKIELIEFYRKNNPVNQNAEFLTLLRNKAMRSQSGVTVVTCVMPPGTFSCDFDCHYCPNDPTIARSYLFDEPAVRRCAEHGWDAFESMIERLNMYYINGHPVDKLEVIILGGTFSSYRHDIAEEFIRDLYYASNMYAGLVPNADEIAMKLHNSRIETKQRLSLENEIYINQFAKTSIIGLTVETRPDQIHTQELERFRRYGVTRVQLGIQSIYDDHLKIVNRQCPTRKNIHAIKLLKCCGFKVDLHFMPDLPGATPESDRVMFKQLFSNANINMQGDQLKIYPTMVLPFTKIKEWHESGQYTPYADTHPDEMFNLLTWICENCPPWIRINRIVRDFHSKYITGGVKDLGLRSQLQKVVKKHSDIRSREVKNREFDPDDAQIHMDKYFNSDGWDIFIEYSSKDRSKLYGFVRLRFNNPDVRLPGMFQHFQGYAFIRELHVYGQVKAKIPDQFNVSKSQHLGIGTLLMKTAEKYAWDKGYRNIAVIAGVGVRNYYANKLGYRLFNTYMVKHLMEDPMTEPGLPTYKKIIIPILIVIIAMFIHAIV